MRLEDCKYEEIGTINGVPISACTDSGGSQVIVGGRKQPIHLLSDDFGTHEAACAAARCVVRRGLPATKGYSNLKDPHEGFFAFGMMMMTSQIKGQIKR